MPQLDTLAIYGGTFNPVHAAHIELVRQCLSTFEFEQLHVLPSYLPDYKATPVAAEHRLAMLSSAFASFDRVMIDEREIERQGVTYTIDTVRDYRAELGDGAKLFFIMGSDSWMSFTEWHDWQEIIQLVNVVVVSRAQDDGQGRLDVAQMNDELAELYRHCVCDDVTEFIHNTAGKVFEFSEMAMNVSSTQLRRAIQGGLPTHEWLLPQVKAYIDEHKLYRNDE
ncbi:MAG: nicotinate (nicotinamide) nucleotide adenylyltransferase [Pseudomonadota bacterium]